MTIKARFEKYTKKIKPTPEHIEEANRQTDYMISQLKNKVSANGSLKLEKILKAGSNAEFASLRGTEENIFDVDLGAYYSGEGVTKDQLGKLIQFTRDQLRSIYHQKEDEDFEKLKSAARVKFRSGIKHKNKGIQFTSSDITDRQLPSALCEAYTHDRAWRFEDIVEQARRLEPSPRMGTT